MCGRFRLALPNDALPRLFDLPPAPDLAARFNIAPNQPVLAVRAAADGRLESWRPRWGLVPPWAKPPTQAQLINARAETASEKPAFRRPFRTRRCLLPADGFYEWPKRAVKGPRPAWLFTLADDGPFAFAGLWERSIAPDGGPVETVTILTTGPNELLARIHDRMPVILPPEDFDLWLDPAVQDPARVQGLLKPHPAERMRAVHVGTYVNDPHHEGPACSAPAPGGGLLLP